MTHDDDTCPHLVRASLLEAENARLKAEVERLTEDNQFLRKADSYLQNGINNANEERCIELEAQVERLTKAGDAMAAVCGWDFYDDSKAVELVNNWEASKEGRDNR